MGLPIALYLETDNRLLILINAGEKMRKSASAVMLTVFLISTLILGLKSKPVKSVCDIYIMSTGVVGTDKIEQIGELYKFTGNITECIHVARDNIIIDGCGFTLEGDPTTYRHGIEMWYKHNVTIKNLTIKGFIHGVFIRLSSKIILLSNNISVGSVREEQAGIYLHQSSESTIYGNRFSNNSQGILLYDSNRTNIFGNEFVNNEGQIELRFSSDNTIFQNNMSNSTRSAILLYLSSNNSIYENNITNSYNSSGYGNGIGLFALSSNNTLSGNNITNNDYGIRLHFSNCNIISGNNIVNNREGVHLEYSYDNKFYSNNFIDNAQHVNIPASGYANIWADGYPVGNYWSNYTDIDQFSGPYQNETGSDGIWDNPYVIDENNIDNYPLIPELQSLVFFPLFIMGTLLAAIVYRKKIQLTPTKD